MRLRSDIWVDAYRRRCEKLGGFVTLRRRGASEAGAIFLCVSGPDRLLDLYGPAPQTAYAHAGMSRKFHRLNREPWTALDLEPYLDKQLRFDPDLWLLDIDDNRKRHFLMDDELYREPVLSD